MNVSIHSTAQEANEAAASLLAGWLARREVRTLLVASGNTPLDLYRLVAGRRLALEHLMVFALDEYVGVPADEPRNCANLLRRTVAEAWGVPEGQFFGVSSVESEALASIQAHESRMAKANGLDLAILGLGQNGHLGFNEPGSSEHSVGRLVPLEPISVEANRKWFGGQYAPNCGVTAGLKTILSARRILLQAYGAHKTAAVQSMIQGPRGEACPASLLQGHPQAFVFLDHAAASGLAQKPQ